MSLQFSSSATGSVQCVSERLSSAGVEEISVLKVQCWNYGIQIATYFVCIMISTFVMSMLK